MAIAFCISAGLLDDPDPVFAVACPFQSVFMAAGNGNVDMVSLYPCALVLHNADSNIFDVDHRAIREKRLVCRHSYIRLDWLPAGGDPRARAADVLAFLGACLLYTSDAADD